ncbi:hypothetical protein [Pseudomonas sp. DP16D-R1]|uniref:hypothetical protein n=1 Tax=Pseudomonas sp. DP16D-R1 TaxID=2075551 RepID=UPI000CD0F62B|nr:hypothetical protein [Pseudomonas sp. DP16D-R1]POA74393.1 hypothetical protein C1890_25190 [Pseudomonas sp. DP16D-R1]
MNVQLIQVNLFVNYGVDRVGQLISELNVHYNALLNYGENGLGESEFAKKELIDAYAKLHELSEFLRHEGGTQTVTVMLDSIIALLKLTKLDQPVRGKLKSLGKQVVQWIHPDPLSQLLDEALRYRWLRKYNLVQPSMDSAERRVSSRWSKIDKHETQRLELPPSYKFEPSDIELENYFNSNKVDLLHYLVKEVQPNVIMQDPMRRPDAKALYHYTAYLDQF